MTALDAGLDESVTKLVGDYASVLISKPAKKTAVSVFAFQVQFWFVVKFRKFRKQILFIYGGLIKGLECEFPARQGPARKPLRPHIAQICAGFRVPGSARLGRARGGSQCAFFLPIFAHVWRGPHGRMLTQCVGICWVLFLTYFLD